MHFVLLFQENSLYTLHLCFGQLQATSEKSKKLKFDRLLCLKNTFLQLKHYIQWIYLRECPSGLRFWI